MGSPITLMPDGALKRQGDSLVPQDAACSVYLNANTSVAHNAVVPFNTKLFDPYNWWSTSTNRLTPTFPGYYRVSVRVRAGAPATWQRSQIRKNASVVHDLSFQHSDPGESVGTAIVYLNGTTDYVDIQNANSDATSKSIFGGSSEHTYFHAELISSSVGVSSEPWHEVGTTGEPAFQNSWVNHTPGTNSTVAFYKDPGGVVRLKGLAKNGTMGQVIFTLPAGYRPTLDQHHVTASNGQFAFSHVRANGEVTSNSPAGSNGWYSLDAISFKAEK